VLSNDRVCTGGVDDVNVLQEIDRRGYGKLMWPNGDPLRLLPMTKDGDLGGRGRNSLFEHRLPDESVDERAFARVEFAHHYEQEELVELLD
jgi:hypothetical protein